MAHKTKRRTRATGRTKPAARRSKKPNAPRSTKPDSRRSTKPHALRSRRSDDRAVGVDVATGPQDAQIQADLSIEELEAELETEGRGQKDVDHAPVLSAGDVQAAWDQDSGEETVGGSNPTPDQDQVDEIGRAAGLTYADTEPLHTTEKLERRDDNRWELDPASDEDYVDRKRELDTPPPPRRRRPRPPR